VVGYAEVIREPFNTSSRGPETAFEESTDDVLEPDLNAAARRRTLRVR